MSRPRTRPGPIGAVALLVALALGATACTAGDSGSNQDVGKAGVDQPTTIEFWHFFTDREATAIEGVVHDFEASHPKIHVVLKPGQDDAKMNQAISAGQGPDLGLSYSTDIVGKFCQSGAALDLQGYLTRDKVDMSKIPAQVQAYTKYRG